jgi:hypothetical protein
MAKDATDKATAEIPGLPPIPKKRGRPAGPRPAKSIQQRQQKLRECDATALAELDSNKWNKRQCFMALSRKEWEGTALGEAAWEQLGKLMGYPKQPIV